MFLQQKVPPRRILNLCPKFKTKILNKGVQGLNVELDATASGTTCNMAQPIDLPKMRDDKVAKNNVGINQRELKGVVLDGGSTVNVIKDTAQTLGLSREPIPFSMRVADNTTIVPKGIIRNVKI